MMNGKILKLTPMRLRGNDIFKAFSDSPLGNAEKEAIAAFERATGSGKNSHTQSHTRVP
jgi:hypothetical protein